MIPTIQTLLRALSAPDLSFATLCDARVVVGGDGLPILERTTRFVETQILWQGENWLLSMPLNSASMHYVERTVKALKPLHTSHLTKYMVLPEELIWCDALGHERRCDMLLQHLPAGKTFAQALTSEPKERLREALDRLELGLGELNFSHNNLKPENLRWCAQGFVPLRYHDATMGVGSDRQSFDALRVVVDQVSQNQVISDTQAPYTPLDPIVGHKWRGNIFEGLICVEDESGWGFVDTHNVSVIAPNYLWVSDFREGRAEVETTSGMGLIDRKGCSVIAPNYEIVDYRPSQSIAWVRQGGKWAIFDYLGKRLTEFGVNYEI